MEDAALNRGVSSVLLHASGKATPRWTGRDAALFSGGPRSGALCPLRQGWRFVGPLLSFRGPPKRRQS